jgi:hypothetical protein
MDVILNEIEAEKENRFNEASGSLSEREASCGIMNAVIKKHIEANPWLNRDTLSNYKRLKEKSEANKIPYVVIKNKKDSVSTLTPVTVDTPSVHRDKTTTDLPIVDVPNDNQNHKKRGRPKRTTKKELFSSKRKKQMALNYAAVEASTAKESIKKTGERVPKGTYDKIIKEAEQKFVVEEGSISKLTLLSRLREGRKTVAAGRGHVSPLIGLEAHFVDVCCSCLPCDSLSRQPVH